MAPGERRGRGLGRPALTGASLSQPEVLHMIYLRALQIVYGTRLEHFYMVGSPPPPAAGCRFSGPGVLNKVKGLCKAAVADGGT